MDELFSCRNCIHNPSQMLSLGKGPGFCLKFGSMIFDPARTTCKYLHRKDLAQFVVDEGVREHAAEFANLPDMANLETKERVDKKYYSEEYVWKNGVFEPTMHAVAQYHKATKKWILIQSFASGVDGIKSSAYSSLIRRYMHTCETWRSSYRLVLAFVQQVDETPIFPDRALIFGRESTLKEARESALWDVVFSRISTVQEYGWHAGLEKITWITDELNGAFIDLDWAKLRKTLSATKSTLTEVIIRHAESEGQFFPDSDDYVETTPEGIE